MVTLCSLCFFEIRNSFAEIQSMLFENTEKFLKHKSKNMLYTYYVNCLLPAVNNRSGVFA